jgi:hypothetical protein
MASAESLRRRGQTSALVGASLWLALVLLSVFNLLHLELIERLMLLATLVIVPLGLSLAATEDREGRCSLPLRAALFAQPVGALMVVCSVLLPQGWSAALLASGWLVVTMLIALSGIVRFLPRGASRVEEVSIDAGLLYIMVGGGWLVLARAGLQPLGFGDTIVLLTAVHFHYAGFAAPILAGLAGQQLHGASNWTRRTLCVSVACIIAGTPLVAAGITFSPSLALTGAIVVAAGLLLLALLVLTKIMPALHSMLAQTLLIISSLSSAAAMVLACVYAYSIVSNKMVISIPQMAELHGVANAVGFSLCGLLAWSLIRPQTRASVPGVPFSRLRSRGYTGPQYFESIDGVSSTDNPPKGLVDDFDDYMRDDFDTRRVDKDVRAFYEQTYRYKLLVRPRWKFGFRLGGRVAHKIGTWMGQMRLPVVAEKEEDRIESRILPVKDVLDGRKGVRAWVRTYEGTNDAMYVAAYATHSHRGNTYMNIAFPMPCGNMASILHLQATGSADAEPQGIILSTLPDACAGGDQGVYFVNPLLPIRLPINETIRVWSVSMKDVPFAPSNQMEGKATVLARHDMWLCGIKFLELDYEIFPDVEKIEAEG